MSIVAYRIVKTTRAASAFDGEGARLYGGRWNSIGTRVVYVAGSRSLATLELLVHTEDLSVIARQFSLIPVTIPERVVLRIPAEELSSRWFLPVPVAETQILGDLWIVKKRSAVLEVPSAVTNEESNYLINPAHRDFGLIGIGDPAPFRMDPRLG